MVAKARKCRSREHAAIQARTLGEVKRGEATHRAAVLLVEPRGCSTGSAYINNCWSPRASAQALCAELVCQFFQLRPKRLRNLGR